jgi:hypothetical protein
VVELTRLQVELVQRLKLLKKSKYLFLKQKSFQFKILTKIFFSKRVHIKIDEKINLTCGKDGGVQNLEVLGVLTVRVANEGEGKIRIGLRNNDTRNLQLQVRFHFNFEFKN